MSGKGIWCEQARPSMHAIAGESSEFSQPMRMRACMPSLAIACEKGWRQLWRSMGTYVCSCQWARLGWVAQFAFSTGQLMYALALGRCAIHALCMRSWARHPCRWCAMKAAVCDYACGRSTWCSFKHWCSCCPLKSSVDSRIIYP